MGVAGDHHEVLYALVVDVVHQLATFRLVAVPTAQAPVATGVALGTVTGGGLHVGQALVPRR